MFRGIQPRKDGQKALYFIIYLQEMDQDSIRREMNKISINFDMPVIQGVLEFLKNYYQRNPLEKPVYQVAAATTIVCETIKLPTVNKHSHTGSGIGVEAVMRHLGQLSKEEFLNTLLTLAENSGGGNDMLLQKVGRIVLAFRIFKKYTEIFTKMSSVAAIQKELTDNLMPFFWIMFLLTKKYMGALDDLNESATILVTILQEIFCHKFGKASLDNFQKLVHSQNLFPQVSRAQQTMRKQVINYMEHLMKNIEEARGQDNFFTIEKIKEKQHMLTRFLDDLNQVYVQEMKNLPSNAYVDEVAFLGLSKDLTPLVFYTPNRNKAISKVINFQDDDSESEEQNKVCELGVYYQPQDKKFDCDLPKKLFSSPSFGKMPALSSYPSFGPPGNSLFQNSSSNKDRQKPDRINCQYTPVSRGMSKNNWIKNFVRNVNVATFQNFIGQSLGSQIFQSIKSQFLSKIGDQVSGMTPHAENRQTQKQFIWKLFLGLNKEAMEIQSIRDLVTDYERFLKPLVCFCGSLYNHIVRSLNLQVIRYCKIYEVETLNFVISLRSIDQLQLPSLIHEYLMDIEKQVLIKEIWDSEQGYKFLQKNFNKEKCSEEVQWIFQRMQKQACLRVRDICEPLNISSKVIDDSQSVVEYLLKQNTRLLEKNSVEAMIICSVLAVLSTNKEKNPRIIKIYLRKYCHNVYRPHTGCPASMFCQEKEEMSLLQYYNQVFLNELELMEEGQVENVCKVGPFQSLKQPTFKIQNIEKYLPNYQKPDYNPFSLEKQPISLKRVTGLDARRNKQMKQLFNSLKASKKAEDHPEEGLNEGDNTPESPTFGPRGTTGSKKLHENSPD